MKPSEKDILTGIFVGTLAYLLYNEYKKNVGKEPPLITGIPKVYPHGYTRISRITQPIARKAGIQAADIIFHQSVIDHIQERHSAEYRSMGVGVHQYIQLLAKNFNQIRLGSNGSLLLVHTNPLQVGALAVELNEIIVEGKQYYIVKTAFPVRQFTESQPLLWERK